MQPIARAPESGFLVPADFEALDLARRLLDKVSDCPAVRPLMARVVSELARPCRHSVDYASVLWHGRQYYFSATQGRIVRELWRAWTEGTPDVRQETLLELAGSESKLSALFADNPAWNQFIVPGHTKGAYRLADDN